MKAIPIFIQLLLLSLITSCNHAQKDNFNISTSIFGETPQGTAMLYHLESPDGMSVDISNYGGTIVRWRVPEKAGDTTDIVLGYDLLSDYLDSPHYFGGITGRYTNRIAHAEFTSEGEQYPLRPNDGPHQLHGGLKGFDKVLWKAETSQTDSSAILRLHYISPHLAEGYPGNLQVSATYQLKRDHRLEILFEAQTDQTTLCNISQNVAFNLNGSGSMLDHRLRIHADRYTPVDSLLIPTGEQRPVASSPFDFREFRSIGDRITQEHPQLQHGNGYDHNFVLLKSPEQLALAAEVQANTLQLELWTNHPGLQLYTGNFLSPRVRGKNQQIYDFRNGFSLTPQHFPDSPHHPTFPPAILAPGQTYRHSILFKIKSL